ncbi:MAG: HAD family hydrolase [Caldimicrobium sp.]
MKALLKLIVFDCDGVLFDSKLANKEYYNFILKEAGRHPLTEKELDYVHMHSLPECLDYLFKDYPELKSKGIEIAKKTSYAQFFSYMKIEEGLEELLSWLHSRCFIALCTNRTTSTEPLLKHFNLYHYFHLIRTALDYSKNDPKALQSILDHFRISPSKALYIGDSTIDEKLALACGVPLVSYKNPTLKAIKIVYHYHELKSFLLQNFHFEDISL